jgi:hypothetical protein
MMDSSKSLARGIPSASWGLHPMTVAAVGGCPATSLGKKASPFIPEKDRQTVKARRWVLYPIMLVCGMD